MSTQQQTYRKLAITQYRIGSGFSATTYADVWWNGWMGPEWTDLAVFENGAEAMRYYRWIISGGVHNEHDLVSDGEKGLAELAAKYDIDAQELRRMCATVYAQYLR